MPSSKCKICGITSEECHSWFKCPMFKGKDELVCHTCHEKCLHLKIFNGYMELCLMRNKPEKA